jgi:hypothetical protein
MTTSLSIATWKYDKSWVYSITYDEALVELDQYVIPHHLEFGIPGHVEVVAGHMGKMRELGLSSFNGLHHRSGQQLKELMEMGWGVGCHSWSHGMVMDDPVTELLTAKQTIEDAIGKAVTIYSAPGSNANMTDEILDRVREYGYLGAFGISDNINYPDPDDLLWLNRVTLHELFSSTFHSVYDAHKRIRQAQENHGWIADYCHCPLPVPLHMYKDCTADHHRERFATVTAEGKAECWYANPDDVVDYRYMRRHSRVESSQSPGDYTVRVESLPEQVQLRDLTFRVEGNCVPEALTVLVDGVVTPAVPSHGAAIFTVAVKDGTKINITPKRQL